MEDMKRFNMAMKYLPLTCVKHGLLNFHIIFCRKHPYRCRNQLPSERDSKTNGVFNGPNPWYDIQRVALTVNHDREIHVQRCIAIIIYIHNSQFYSRTPIARELSEGYGSLYVTFIKRMDLLTNRSGILEPNCAKG